MFRVSKIDIGARGHVLHSILFLLCLKLTLVRSYLNTQKKKSYFGEHLRVITWHASLFSVRVNCLRKDPITRIFDTFHKAKWHFMS